MGKSLFANSIYNVLYKMLNVLFPLISTVIVSRALLPEGVGKVSAAQNIVTYFTFAACLGLPNYGTREIAKNKEDTSKVFTELFALNFCSTFLCAMAYYIMISVVSRYFIEYKLYAVAGLTIVFNVFNVDWLYQGKEEYKYIAFRSLVVKIVMMIFIVLFVKDESDYITYALIYCLALAGNYLFNILNLKRMNVKFVYSELKIYRHLSSVMILFLSTVAVELYSLLDVTMLAVMCSDEIVGYYSNSMKLIKVAISVITAISGVLLPRLSRYLGNGDTVTASKLVKNVLNVMFFFSFPCMIGMFMLSEEIVVVLFGIEFLPSAICVKLLSLLFMAIPISNLFGVQVLIAYGEEKKVLIGTMLGAITNIMLNVLLIQYFNQNGAAVASVISEILVAVVMIVFSKNIIEISLNMKAILKCLVSGGCMSAFIAGASIYKSYSPIWLFSVIAISGILYLIINVLIQNEIFSMVRKKMIKEN